MLCCLVTSYRSVKMGVVGKGDASQTQSSKIMKNVSTVTGYGTQLPLLGPIFSVISSIAAAYVEMV